MARQQRPTWAIANPNRRPQMRPPARQNVPATTPATPVAPAAPAGPPAPVDYSLQALFPQYATGAALPALATTPFGGAVPADQQAATMASWRDFFETVRRYNQDYELARLQDSRNYAENVRQFQSQFEEANRRYNQEWPWLQKRDAYSVAGAAFLPNARFLTR